jgi:hypothetical protein
MDEIPIDGKADAFLSCFVWPFGGYKSCIGGFPSLSSGIMAEVGHGFGAGGHVRENAFG